MPRFHFDTSKPANTDFAGYSKDDRDCQQTKTVSDSDFSCHGYVLQTQCFCKPVPTHHFTILGGKADLIKRGLSFAELPTVAAALCSLVFTSDTAPENRSASAPNT